MSIEKICRHIDCEKSEGRTVDASVRGVVRKCRRADETGAHKNASMSICCVPTPDTFVTKCGNVITEYARSVESKPMIGMPTTSSQLSKAADNVDSKTIEHCADHATNSKPKNYGNA